MLHLFAKRLKELHEKKRDERGFTLIELLVVITLPFHEQLHHSQAPAQLISTLPSVKTSALA